MFAPFPGWPGPTMFGNRMLIAPVALPALPVFPGHPAMIASPQAPPAAEAAQQDEGKGEADVSGTDQAAGEEQQAQQPPPWALPFGRTPSGQGVLLAGGTAGSLSLPPEIPGMPKMPGPPDGMMTGGPQGGGLFMPMAPVLPFDFSNQVRQLQQQGRPT